MHANEARRGYHFSVTGRHPWRSQLWEGASLAEDSSEYNRREVLSILDTTVDDCGHDSGHEGWERPEHAAVRVYDQRNGPDVEPLARLGALKEALARAKAD